MDINNENMRDLHRTILGAFRDALSAPSVVEYTAISNQFGSSSTDNLYPFLNDTDGMREWFGDALFEQLKSGRYSITNRKFQKGLTAERDQILDDQGGLAPLLASHTRIQANACMSHPDELVIGETLAGGETLLCFDGQPFFDNSHPNQNDDGGVQDNLIEGASTPWYLFDLSKALKPLVYQLREPLQIAGLTDMSSDSVFHTHTFKWNMWIRDAAGFGPWWTAVKSKEALTEASFRTARTRLQGFHLGVKDRLVGVEKYRSARSRATHIMVPLSMEETARKLFGQERLASGETNDIRNAVQILVSNYL
jgi:phage major head subunit gpT-like protein